MRDASFWFALNVPKRLSAEAAQIASERRGAHRRALLRAMSGG